MWKIVAVTLMYCEHDHLKLVVGEGGVQNIRETSEGIVVDYATEQMKYVGYTYALHKVREF